jgi:MYXO-CTERM domain-containing protein
VPDADAMVDGGADGSDGLVESGSAMDVTVEVRDAPDTSQDVSQDASRDAGRDADVTTVADAANADGANADVRDSGSATDGAVARDVVATDANPGEPPGPFEDSDDGCGCHVGRSDQRVSPALLGFASLILLGSARRKRRTLGSNRRNL